MVENDLLEANEKQLAAEKAQLSAEKDQLTTEIEQLTVELERVRKHRILRSPNRTSCESEPMGDFLLYNILDYTYFRMLYKWAKQR